MKLNNKVVYDINLGKVEKKYVYRNITYKAKTLINFDVNVFYLIYINSSPIQISIYFYQHPEKSTQSLIKLLKITRNYSYQ